MWVTTKGLKDDILQYNAKEPNEHLSLFFVPFCSFHEFRSEQEKRTISGSCTFFRNDFPQNDLPISLQTEISQFFWQMISTSGACSREPSFLILILRVSLLFLPPRQLDYWPCSERGKTLGTRLRQIRNACHIILVTWYWRAPLISLLFCHAFPFSCHLFLVM